ncbi:MAG: pilus assembly protein PilZ [Proteobacteria bacterium]|nr:MAG: pilus assembly protein PilZ [Pseudomonadota bacterium]
MRDFSEKRDFIRMKVDTEISLKDNSGKTIQAICRDLSGAGMLIVADEKVQEGTELLTSIPSNNQAFPPFDATVKVVRCTRQDNGKYELGTEILDIKK